MNVRSFDELMLLPERVAAERHFDGINWRRARWLLAGYVIACLVTLAIFFTSQDLPRVWVSIADLVVLAGLFVVRNSSLVARSFRPLLMTLVVLQLVATGLWGSELALILVFGAGVFPALLVLLRFRSSDLALLAGAFVAVVAAWEILHGFTTAAVLRHAAAVAVPNGLAAFAGARLTGAARTEFLDRWRRAVSRERDRQRMRGELADARKIQLSMLPAGDPTFDWIEVSGACIPAAEVGGDYYDYIPLGKDAVAIVVADVAGHGVASGLLIAGLRSSLYVLQDELVAPAAVLEKLNSMVRASVRARTFVTVTIAVVERSGRRLRVASAGHPPVFLRRGDGSVVELGAPAPPLGTHLPSRYSEESAVLEPGDLFLLYTDGLVEAIDFRTDCYGFDRLRDALSRSASTGPAREVRNDLLDDISRFKGQALQTDDLSLVVGRWRPEAG